MGGPTHRGRSRQRPQAGDESDSGGKRKSRGRVHKGQLQVKGYAFKEFPEPEFYPTPFRGITISRRPNILASTEKAPGPRNAIAVAMVTPSTVARLASCELQARA